jgi:hypothetical protein
LTALSNHGQNVEPFEMSIAELLADWLEKIVLGNDSNISVLATDVSLKFVLYLSKFEIL